MSSKINLIAAALSISLCCAPTLSNAATVKEAMHASPTAVNLNNSIGFAFYGANTDIANTDAANVASFTNLRAVTANQGFGTSSANGVSYGSNTGVTYTGGTPQTAESMDTMYSYAGYGSGSSLTLSTTVLSSSETLDFYLTNYDATSDITVTVGGNTYEFDNLVLDTPDSSAADGTGSGLTSSLFTLSLTGVGGDVATFTDSTDETGVTNSLYGSVGIQAVTVASIATAGAAPEPSTTALLFGSAALLGLVLRSRKLAAL